MAVDALIQTLISNFFSYFQDCGPQHVYTSMHPKIETGFSSLMPFLPNIIPDNGYHPQVKICIDFSHQFTAISNKTPGKRPLEPKIFQSYAQKLLNYVSYYSDYVLSYRGQDQRDQTEFQKAYSNADISNEKSLLEFVNTIVNWFVTDIAIDRARGEIGTCTVTLRDNQNIKKGKKSSIFADHALTIFNQLFAPLLPISVWARGRIYKDWYFPLFDGYIMAASPANAAGFTSITITCKDVLELARTSMEMINPAIIQMEEFKTQGGINIMAKPLFNHDHKEIFHKLFNGGDLEFNPETSTVKARASEPTGTPDKLNFTALDNFATVGDDNPELLVGVLENRVLHKDEFSISKLVDLTSHKRERYTITWGGKITPYRGFQFQSPDSYTSEFSSRLDIMQEVSQMVYWDFYVDGFGNVLYHPMRFVNEYLTNAVLYRDSKKTINFSHMFPGVQVIDLKETLNQSTLFNIDELTTFAHLEGIHTTAKANPQALDLVGSAADMELMKKYGFRRKSLGNQLFNENFQVVGAITFLDLAALSWIKYMNGELYTRQATIAFRPEMDIALPVYFVDDNTIFYCRSMSHSISIGGDATTTINGAFGRKEYEKPADLASFLLLSERVLDNNPKDVVTEEDKQALIKSIPAEEWKNSFGIDDAQAAHLQDQYTEALNVGLDAAKEAAKKLFEQISGESARARAETMLEKQKEKL